MSPIDSRVNQNIQQLHPIYLVECLFIINKTNMILVIVLQVSLTSHAHITAIASPASQPVLSPYWSRPKNSSALLSSLQATIFSEIFEACGIRVVVQKQCDSTCVGLTVCVSYYCY